MPNEDQETKITQLRPDMFAVTIQMTDELEDLLGHNDVARMYTKLERIMVPLTQDQCMGMARGTIKYPSDNYTPNQLMMHMMEEIRDQVNYVWMWRDAVNQEAAYAALGLTALRGKVEITEE